MEKRNIFPKVRKTLNENIANNVSRKASGNNGSKHKQQYYAQYNQFSQLNGMNYGQPQMPMWNQYGYMMPQQGVNPYATLQKTKPQTDQFHTRNFGEQLNHQRKKGEYMYDYVNSQHIQNQYIQFNQQSMQYNQTPPQQPNYSQQYQQALQTKSNVSKKVEDKKKLTREERRAKLRGYSLVKTSGHRNYTKKPISGQITPNLLQPSSTSGLYRNYQMAQAPSRIVQFMVNGVSKVGTVDLSKNIPKKQEMVHIIGSDGNSYVRERRSVGLHGDLPTSTSINGLENEIQEKVKSIKEDQIQAIWSEINKDKNVSHPKIITDKVLATKLFGSTQMIDLLAAQRILQEFIYFEPLDNFEFKCRTQKVVEQLKIEEAETTAKKNLMKDIVNMILEHLRNGSLMKLNNLNSKQKHAVEQIKKFAMGLSRDQDIKDYVIKPLQLDVDEPSETYKVLYTLGVFDYENPYLARAQFYNLPYAMTERSKEVNEELKTISKNPDVDPDAHLRVNLTHLKAFAIDSVETTEVDDAISVDILPNGNIKYYVHVADVSRVIERNSKLDLSARRRATTLYLPEQVVTMFPKGIADKVFSLLADKENYSMTFCMQINENGEVSDYEVFPAKLAPVLRFTYDEVNEILESQPDHQYFDDFQLLLDGANTRFKYRSKYSSLKLFLPSPRLFVTYPENRNNPHIEHSFQSLISASKRMVEEMMIAANEVASLFTNENSIPIAYRGVLRNDEIQPFKTKIEEKRLDITETPKFHYSEEEQAELVLFSISNRIPTRACISELPVPHAGLGIQSYIQVTSPIRRYSDLMVHFQIKDFLRKKQNQLKFKDLEAILRDVDQNFKMASILQKDSERFWFNHYLKRNINQVYDGTVLTIEEKPSGQYILICYLHDVQFRARLLVNKALSVRDRIKLRCVVAKPHFSHNQFELVE